MPVEPRPAINEPDYGDDAQRWHVVQSKPKAEREACEQLRRQGYVVMLPELVLPRKRWEALFPRYMFLRTTSTEQSIAPVRYTLGVSQLVRFASKPATVPNDIVVASMEMAKRISGQDEVVSHGLESLYRTARIPAEEMRPEMRPSCDSQSCTPNTMLPYG